MANVDELRRKVENRGGFIAQRLAMDLKVELDVAALPHKKTGAMEAGNKVTWSRVSPTRWRVVASNQTLQAATTNSGARPHVIRPRNRKALAFKSGGVSVVVRSVNHPGNKGDHWFDRVMSHERVASVLARFVGR